MKRFLSTKLGTLLAVALVVTVSSLGGSLAYAIFGATATATANTATAGIGAIEFSVDTTDGIDGTWVDSLTNPINLASALAKTGTSTLGGSIHVRNNGAGTAFTYGNTVTVTSGGSNNVDANLQGQVTVVAAGAICTEAAPVGTYGAAGSWATSLAIAAGRATLNSNGAAERLCYYFKLPTTTPSGAQGEQVGFTLTFNAVN